MGFILYSAGYCLVQISKGSENPAIRWRVLSVTARSGLPWQRVYLKRWLNYICSAGDIQDRPHFTVESMNIV